MKPPGDSIFGERRVDLVSPREDAPGEITALGKAKSPKQFSRLASAPSHFAVHDDLSLGIEFGVPRFKFAEGYQHGAL